MKILIIQTAFTGDVVLATSLAEKLHRFFPKSEIHFLVRKGNASLFNDHPFVKKVLVFDKKAGKVSQLLRLLSTIRSSGYSHVINLHRFASSGFLTAFSGANERIGFDKNPLSFLFTKKVKHEFGDKDRPVHEIDRNLALIKHLTDDTRQMPVLYPPEFINNKVSINGDYVCMAPASVWKTKQWPEENWIKLIQKMPETTSIVLLGGPADQSLCQGILENSRRLNIHNMAGQLTFLESCALMKGAKMNYVNDSAPTHFASSVNAPVTTIFCSTIPDFGFTPLSDHSKIVQTEHKLECRPCGIHGKKACPLGHFKCAESEVEIHF